MTAPREFIMDFNFKIVYTTIVYNIEISSHATVKELFNKACVAFEPYINYDKYFIDYVITGQNKGELALAFGEENLQEPLWRKFNRWKQVSFYIRPIDRNINRFILMDSYNEQIQIREE
jgi:hypothetical protein